MFYLYINNFCEVIRFLLFLLLPFIGFSQVNFNLELLDNWNDENIICNSTQIRYNDCWGFTLDGKEYAIIGSTEGTHYFSISDDNKFEELDFVPGKYQATTVIHRDIKTYQHYAYAVCDEGNSSLQIIDLSYLPDSVSVVGEMTDNFIQTHNLFIDEDNARLYSCGPLTTMGDYNIQVYDLTDPVNPALLWSGFSLPYVHDAYVRNNIAYLSCGDYGLRVYNFSDPANPVFLQNLDIYSEQGYNHQGWMTPSGNKFFFGDETNGKKIKQCEVQNNLLTIDNTFGTNYNNGSIPHNMMCSDDFLYVAYYNEGLRIYDIRGEGAIEVAHYDTYPDESEFKMHGAWGIYSELPSGRLLVSDRTYGLFLLDFREDIFSISSGDQIQVYPNPVGQSEMITIQMNGSNISSRKLTLYTSIGQLYKEVSITDQSYAELEAPTVPGCYHLIYEYNDYLGDLQRIHRKIIIH